MRQANGVAAEELDALPFRRYVAGLAAAAVGMLMLFGAVMVLLDGTGNLPPPALSNRVCADEKLRFFREHPPERPDLAIMGSSVAWRGFNGATLMAALPGRKPVNGGICGLNLRQTEFATDWLLSNLPTVRHVLLIVAPPDAENCGNAPEAVFDRSDATAYAFGHAWPGLFYLRYFDPVSFLRNARTIAAQKANRVPLDPLVFTPTGDGPLDTTVTRDTLLYGASDSYDGACFAALHSLAGRLATRGLSLAVVLAPTSPVWKAQADGDGNARRLLDAGVEQAIAGTGATFWNADALSQWPATAFTDAIHLRWSAVERFTREIIENVPL